MVPKMSEDRSSSDSRSRSMLTEKTWEEMPTCFAHP